MNVLKQLIFELEEKSDHVRAESSKRFHKKPVSHRGIETKEVRKLAKSYFKRINQLNKNEIYELAEKLLKSKYQEDAVIAVEWVSKCMFEETDFKTFEKWIEKYIDNWGRCDDFCLHVMNPFIQKYPIYIPYVKKWSESKNMWMRRASAVTFITTWKSFYVTNSNIKNIFDVSDTLLKDKEDLVQKGYGWMLKAASVANRKEVFNYVMKNKDKMPRTALRYAIEKMPDKLRKKAMVIYND